jgi:hypothetical protein
LAELAVLAFQNPLRGGPAQPFVRAIHFRQQSNIRPLVLGRKAPPAVCFCLDHSGLAIRPDQSRDLRQAQPRHFAQVGADRSSRLPLLTGVFLMDEHPLHPAVRFGTAFSSEFHPFAGLQKLADLRLR